MVPSSLILISEDGNMLVFLGKYLSLDCPASKPVLFGLYRSDPTAYNGRFAVYRCARKGF